MLVVNIEIKVNIKIGALQYNSIYCGGLSSLYRFRFASSSRITEFLTLYGRVYVANSRIEPGLFRNRVCFTQVAELAQDVCTVWRWLRVAMVSLEQVLLALRRDHVRSHATGILIAFSVRCNRWATCSLLAWDVLFG